MARPRSDIAPRIVHAARARFLAEGVDVASLRRIARDAKTSVGMIYYYFPTKDVLFLAVVEEIYAKLIAEMATALAPEVPVRERMRRLYARFGSASEEELVVIQLVIREMIFSPVRRDLLLERFARGHIPLVLGTLMDGMRDGSIDARRHIALVVLSSVGVGIFAQVVRRIAGERFPIPDAPTGEALASGLTEILFEGIGPRRAPEHDTESERRSP